MLNIYLCEDNNMERRRMSKIIKDTILIENLDMLLKLSAAHPDELLEQLSAEPGPGIYFLDVDLRSDMNGIELAGQIRNQDLSGTIVFVTAHDEMLPLTYRYKVEAMDYIIKDLPDKLSEQLSKCLKSIALKYSMMKNPLSPTFPLKIGSRFVYVKTKDIIYFETASIRHQIILHTTESITQFYNSLNKIENELGGGFFRSHKSYLVNTEHIKALDTAEHKILLSNQELLPIAVHSISSLKLLLNKLTI